MSGTVSSLASLSTLITKGTTPTTLGYAHADSGIPFLRVQNIFGGQVNFEEDTLFIGEDTHAALKRSQIQGGDVLVTIAGTIGRTGVVPLDAPSMNCNQAVAIVRPTAQIDRSYLRHWLESQAARSQMIGSTVTGTISNLSLTQLGELKVPLPQLEEQRRIAAILDQAETLRTQRRTALAQLDSLTQSLFLDMFGDAEVKGWPIETIAAVAHPDKGSMRTGPFGSQLLHSEFVAEGVSVLGIDNAVANEFRWGERRFISEAKYRDLKRYTVKPGDVLITIMGTCGRCAVVPDDIPVAINTKHICCITLDKQKCTPEFLHAYFLRHPMARKYLAQTEKGAIMAGLNMGLIQAMPIAVPPLALQQTFATRIQAIEALKTTHRAALAELDALFASLQQRAFSGELTARASGVVATSQAKRSFAELGQLDALKGVESLVYASNGLPGKGHYWPTKAQYFADKRHLERYGRSIYGETYVAMGRGPVPQAAFNASRALAEGELICEFPMDVVRTALRREGNQLIALRDADTKLLSAQERESLDWAIRYVKDLSFDELQTASHDAAWQKTAANGPMAWEDIICTLEPEAQKRLLVEFA